VRSVRPVVPFRVSGFATRRRALPPRRRPLLEFTARSEFLTRPRSARDWFCAPAAPFALAPVVRSSAAGLPRSQLSDRDILSSSFAFLQSFPRRSLAVRPQPNSTSHGLSVPTAHSGSGDPLVAGVCRRPLRSAFRVWLPSWRLSPAGPASALFRADSAPGIHPSEYSPLRRYPAPFDPDEPTYRFSDRYTDRPEAKGRPGRPRFLGFDPSESSSRPPRD
jgi:hypothetical protein